MTTQSKNSTIVRLREGAYGKRIWAFFMPLSGKSLKGDMRIIEKTTKHITMMLQSNKPMYSLFSEAKKDELRQLNGLKRAYRVIYITDPQFGKINIDYSNNTVTIPFTKKQLDDSFIIGGNR